MFITFEGGEGSGKTTCINHIKKALEKDGEQVVLTREPGGTPISEDIRNIILDKKNTNMDKRTEALLYAASRRQHLVEKIWPNDKAGKIVICDRYLDSSLAYQGGARGIGVKEILKMNEFATEGALPDITFLFDIEPELGLKRISQNSNREINRLDLENIEFHKGVRAQFLKLAQHNKKRYVIIDASKTPDEVFNQVYAVIKKHLNH